MKLVGLLLTSTLVSDGCNPMEVSTLPGKGCGLQLVGARFTDLSSDWETLHEAPACGGSVVSKLEWTHSNTEDLIGFCVLLLIYL